MTDGADAAVEHYADAESLLPFGEQLRDIRGTDLAVMAAYRTTDPTPPGPEVKREHRWVAYTDGEYYSVRLSTGMAQAGHTTFENACQFLEKPESPIYDYEYVTDRVVPVEQTPIPYKRAGDRIVECPECDAFAVVHSWKLDTLADECSECGYGGDFDVEN